jgi:preprotein translocase subunit SecB
MPARRRIDHDHKRSERPRQPARLHGTSGEIAGQKPRFKGSCPQGGVRTAFPRLRPIGAAPPEASLSPPTACVSDTARNEQTAPGDFMSSTNGGQTANPANAPAGDTPPQLNVLAQYIKDFSFENPNAPRSLAPTQQQPAINIQINVGAKQLSTTDVEVELKIEGKAETGPTLLFEFELVYCGVFRIQNIPENDVHPVMMIECPRLLFPFAREIIATAVVNGGFPPLRIDPVDFVGLYRQRMGAAAQQSPIV